MPLPQKLLWVKLPTLWLIAPYIMISSLRGQVNDPTRKKMRDMLSIIDLLKHIQPI